MADRGDTHYHVPHLNLWFLVSSVFFLLTMVWTVIDDWNAEWKGYQRDFRRLELVKAEEAREELVRQGAETQRKELQAAVTRAQETIDASEKELAEALDAIKRDIDPLFDKVAAMPKALGTWLRPATSGFSLKTFVDLCASAELIGKGISRVQVKTIFVSSLEITAESAAERRPLLSRAEFGEALLRLAYRYDAKGEPLPGAEQRRGRNRSPLKSGREGDERAGNGVPD